ncbi:enoyl-CoA hydratase/isomerase family protein [Bacteroidota bacterium]
MTDKILVNKRNHVFEITLNNPAKMNCMGFEMLYALDEAVSKAGKDSEVRALMIKGAGERAFSTGADLKEFQALPDEKADEWIEFGNSVFNRIERLQKPSLALINGYAIGGGFELALACDFRLGTQSAILASVEVQHGWLPGWGGMTRLRRLIGESRAKEVVLLCEKIPAQRALEMGLLTRVLSGGAEDPELEKLLDHLAGLNPDAFKQAKSVLMDPDRTTYGPDVQFDVLAMKAANTKAD